MVKNFDRLIVLISWFLVLAASSCTGPTTVEGPLREVVLESPEGSVNGGIRLSPPENAWDGYGEAVEVGQNLLVIGAPEWNYAGDGRGTVYIYRLSNGTWLEEARLQASDRDDGQEGQRFGNSVALGEDVIAVGAPGTDDPQAGENAGAVYLYGYNGKDWEEIQKLLPARTRGEVSLATLNFPDSARLRPRSFGSLVAVDGDTLAVAGDSGTDLVYVYERGADSWQETARLAIPGSPGKDLYMASLALFGDSLALSAFYGAPQPEEPLLLSGEVIVYVFERTDTGWKKGFQFAPAGAGQELLFLPELNVGAGVALGGVSGRAELLAIGLPGFPDWTGDLDMGLVGVNPDQPDFPPSNRKSGAVYIFERGENGGWTPQVTLRPAGWEAPPGPGSMFSGSASAPENEQGDSGETGLLASAGIPKSFVFPGSIFSEDPEVSFFGATVDLDGSRLAVTAGFANATYVFERQGSEWVYRLRITPGQGVEGLWEDYAQVVRIQGNILLLGTPGEFGNSAYVFDLCSPGPADCF